MREGIPPVYQQKNTHRRIIAVKLQWMQVVQSNLHHSEATSEDLLLFIMMENVDVALIQEHAHEEAKFIDKGLTSTHFLSHQQNCKLLPACFLVK